MPYSKVKGVPLEQMNITGNNKGLSQRLKSDPLEEQWATSNCYYNRGKKRKEKKKAVACSDDLHIHITYVKYNVHL